MTKRIEKIRANVTRSLSRMKTEMSKISSYDLKETVKSVEELRNNIVMRDMLKKILTIIISMIRKSAT